MFSIWSDMIRQATRTDGWTPPLHRHDTEHDAAEDHKQRLREEMRTREKLRHSVWW